MDADAALARFVAHFNAGEYYEAHDALEAAWRAADDEHRRFYQGLIQAAVALYHYRRGRLGGARSLCRKALDKLRPYEPVCRGLDVTRFARDLEHCCADILQGGTAAFATRPIPRID